MQTKLTLRLDDVLIQRAKAYSKRTGKSVSQIVADYFSLLEDIESRAGQELPPKTKALLGALAGATLDEGDYRQHMIDRHR